MPAPFKSLLRACVPLWFIVLSACTTERQTFHGQTADRVWTAMVAVAKTPDYWSTPDVTERWYVRDNEVWDDEATRHIEVLRKLERELTMPNQPVVREEREWKFQMVMEQEDPPTVKFTSRGMEVPARAWREADRYFAQVWEVLGVKSPPPQEAPKPPKIQPTAEQREAVELYDG